MKKLYVFTLIASVFIISSQVTSAQNSEMTVWYNDDIAYYINVKQKKRKTVSCDGITVCNAWEVVAYAKNISKDKILTPTTIFFGPNLIGFETCSFNNQDCIDTFEVIENPKMLKPGKSRKIASWTIYSIKQNPTKVELVQMYEKPVEETHFTVLSRK